MSESLTKLAGLLRDRDTLDAKIAAITRRSARPGDIGEFIAAEVLDIELAPAANHRGHDGRFRSGPLTGRTVNIKLYGNVGNGLDISPHAADFYLVLSGPSPSTIDGVRHRPWQISAAYLFETRQLLETLTERRVQIGTATSIRQADLDAARIFPGINSRALLSLTPEQAASLSLFA